MDGSSLLSVLQQRLLAHPDYAQLTQKLKSDVKNHPIRDEQRTIVSALSKYDKDNKLITTVQQCLLSLGQPNVLAAASTALVSLIKKDRSTVFVLHQFLNQPLAPALRLALWEAVLAVEGIGAAYRDAARDKPYSVLSPQEDTIREKVKGLLQGVPGFTSNQFLYSTTGSNLLVKSLSYWHIHAARPLVDSDYKLILPVVALSWPDDSPESVARVASMLGGLYSLQQALKANDAGTLNMVLQYVQIGQPELSEHVMRLRADLTSSHHAPAAQLIAPLHEKFFVGYLSSEVIVFLLDQCVIGRDVPSYNPLFSYTASVLCLCGAALSQCNNVSSALSHIEQRGQSITTRQLQGFVQVHYLDSLATQLSAKPTRVHFNSKPLTIGEEARESPDNRRLVGEIEELKRKLAEEKKQRNDKHVAHRNEIGMLKAENEDLRRRLKAAMVAPAAGAAVVAAATVPAAVRSTPPTEPVDAPVTPPPMVSAAPPPNGDTEEDEGDGDISGPLEAPLRQKQVQSLWLEVAKNVMQRVKRLAFRDPARKRELDSLTFYLNRQYEEDRARAEVELFGEELPPEAWNELLEEEYFDKIHQIDTVVERYARERFEQSKQPPSKKK